MTILLDRKTAVLVQGITGKIGSFHAKEMMDYGTNIVGGVTPGKGGASEHGVPVFDTMKEAVEKTGATASIVFVPPPFAADSIMEAADAGIRTCVAITDGIPAQDMIKVKRYMRRYRAENRMCLIGPNCAGIISPSKALLGIMPGQLSFGSHRHRRPLRHARYEAAAQMKELGIGFQPASASRDPIMAHLQGHPRTLRADPENLRCDDWRNRWPQSRSRRIHSQLYEEAVSPMSPVCQPKGPQDGPCRCDHLAFGESALRRSKSSAR